MSYQPARKAFLRGLLLALVVASPGFSENPLAQAPSPQGQRPQSPPPLGGGPPAVEKLGDQRFRIGQILVNTAAREISVPGRLNAVSVLEFLANTRTGMKAYESAMTLDTDAVTFNAALLLVGLDPARASVPARHFDPAQPSGDAVDVFVDLTRPAPRRIRAEQLVYDQVTKETLPEGPWVYTGSTFVKNSAGQRTYLAESDGVLIGFVHSPAPIIENPRGAGIGRYGTVVLNPNLGLMPLMPVTLTVKALGTRVGTGR